MTETYETWTTRELPLLRIALREDDKGKNASFEEMAEETQIDRQQVWVAMRSLDEAGYVDAYVGNQHTGFVRSVGERTRRELGSWPSPESLVDQLARAFAAAADRETEPETKTKMRAAAEALAGAGRTTAIELFTAFLRQQAGLP